MKREKIIIIFITAILVVVLIALFLKVFSFESDKNNNETLEYPLIDDKYIEKLYKNLDGHDEKARGSIYNGYYSKYANLSQEVVLAMTLNYVYNNDPFKLKVFSINELKEKNIIKNYENLENYKALYKISEKDFLEGGIKLFGKNSNIQLNNFTAADNIRGYYDKKEKVVLVYEKKGGTSNQEIFKNNLKYTVTNNNNTIYIYDNYINCNHENKNCYNDDKMQNINAEYKIVNDALSKDNLNSAATYKHVFQFENGYYYWYSSELVEK